jgi:hypothetical protein
MRRNQVAQRWEERWRKRLRGQAETAKLPDQGELAIVGHGAGAQFAPPTKNMRTPHPKAINYALFSH